jgi:hypothetical protein
MSTAVAPLTISTVSTISSIALLCHVLISRDGDHARISIRDGDLINRVHIWTQKLFSNILISNLDCDWFEDLIYRATLASPASVVTSSAVVTPSAVMPSSAMMTPSISTSISAMVTSSAISAMSSAVSPISTVGSGRV